jgi:hypothetical protein
MGRPKMEPAKTPKQRQIEEADHEQEQEDMNGHNDPHCLKWGAWRTPREARIRRVSSAVKQVGEKPELSTTVNRCTLLER